MLICTLLFFFFFLVVVVVGRFQPIEKSLTFFLIYVNCHIAFRAINIYQQLERVTMGRIHGFLGGVLLTSTFTYYTQQYINKNQQFISQHLRQSDYIINNRILSDKDAELRKNYIPDSHVNYQSRVSFAETCKDIWNEEIITMVNWLYSINWYKLGLDIDSKVGELTTKLSESVVPNHETKK